MNQQVITTRDHHIDNIKGVLIFLVVLGHLLGYLQETHSTFAIGVRTFIYFFHMPGFVFMSGYLAKSFIRKQYKGEKLLSFAWLYLLFKDAIELIHYIFERPYFEGGRHTQEWLLVVVLFCVGIWLLSWAYSHFPLFQKSFILAVLVFSLLKINMLTVGAAPWYLLSLVLWHIFIYLTRHIKPKYVMTAAIILAAVINYQEAVGKFLSLSRTINFLPFFLLGFYMTKDQFQQMVEHPKLKKVLPVVFILSAFLIIPYGRKVQKWLGVFFFGISPYTKLLELSDLFYYFAPLICILWMAVVMLMLFGLFILCPKKDTFLCQFGKNTIGIYVLHRLFKDFLIYGGFYGILSQNEYVAVAQIVLTSLLLTFILGTKFWAQSITKLSKINTHQFYIEEHQQKQ